MDELWLGHGKVPRFADVCRLVLAEPRTSGRRRSRFQCWREGNVEPRGAGYPTDIRWEGNKELQTGVFRPSQDRVPLWAGIVERRQGHASDFSRGAGKKEG